MPLRLVSLDQSEGIGNCTMKLTDYASVVTQLSQRVVCRCSIALLGRPKPRRCVLGGRGDKARPPGPSPLIALNDASEALPPIDMFAVQALPTDPRGPADYGSRGDRHRGH